jgi:hypothetical protein
MARTELGSISRRNRRVRILPSGAEEWKRASKQRFAAWPKIGKALAVATDAGIMAWSGRPPRRAGCPAHGLLVAPGLGGDGCGRCWQAVSPTVRRA